jgi:hypothetical protein
MVVPRREYSSWKILKWGKLFSALGRHQILPPFGKICNEMLHLIFIFKQTVSYPSHLSCVTGSMIIVIYCMITCAADGLLNYLTRVI